ncbi:MAG: hypothetical protein ACD_79C01183G0001, partial [uncultured bacterium]
MDIDNTTLFFRFGIAVLIGLLVGIQREFASSKTDPEIAAGARTFPLIGLAGCAGALISDKIGSPIPLAVIFLITGLLFSINYFIEASQNRVGLTTKFSAIITMICGAMIYHHYINLSIAIIVVTTVILSWKIEIHDFVHKISKEDVFASLKFAVITCLLLPIFPNKNYGFYPFDAFNPFKIWLLVVLISGISFIGYILIKIAGPRKGMGLTGVLGGIASSTALTLSLTQKSKYNSGMAKSFALAIIISWTVMFPRLLLIIAAVNFTLVKPLILPFTGCVIAGIVVCLLIYRSLKGTKETEIFEYSNPFELLPAIKFGLLFTVILVASKAAAHYFGDTGFYISSMISGIADTDAVALSV